jgi:2-phosphosulfolactate phosphatase
MAIEVYLTPSTVTDDDVKEKTVVVVDVLRSSSTIISALDARARAVIPVSDTEEAGKIAYNLDPNTYVLGGERNGTKIEGYQVGNSPLAYTEELVEGKTVIFNTANGAHALHKGYAAKHLVVGGFLNAGRIATFLRETAEEVVFICGGRQNRISLDDILCVGLILDRIWQAQMPAQLPDATYVAYTTYQRSKDRLEAALHNCTHGAELTADGHSEDLRFCSRLDALPVLPYYSERRITLRS